MQIKPENGQDGKREAIQSVTLESLGELAAVAAGFTQTISRRFEFDHPGHLVLEKYSPMAGFFMPDTLYEHIDDFVSKRRQKIVAADPELSFMQNVINEYYKSELYGGSAVEFAPRTYVDNEAVLVIDGIWEAVKAINGSPETLVAFLG